MKDALDEIEDLNFLLDQQFREIDKLNQDIEHFLELLDKKDEWIYKLTTELEKHNISWRDL
jgi:hypothetical protein